MWKEFYCNKHLSDTKIHSRTVLDQNNCKQKGAYREQCLISSTGNIMIQHSSAFNKTNEAIIIVVDHLSIKSQKYNI